MRGFSAASAFYVHANQACASKESVMSSDPKGQSEFQKIVELDRQAWNLPSPQSQPVGPVRDVWPGRAKPTRGLEPPSPRRLQSAWLGLAPLLFGETIGVRLQPDPVFGLKRSCPRGVET